MANLTHQETLIYFDEPQLYIAADEADARFLCLLVDDGPERIYCCVAVSRECLGRLLANEVDVLSIFADTDSGYWLELPADGIVQGSGIAEPRFEAVPLAYLPGPDLFVGSTARAS